MDNDGYRRELSGLLVLGFHSTRRDYRSLILDPAWLHRLVEGKGIPLLEGLAVT
jgi:hypothetical protein